MLLGPPADPKRFSALLARRKRERQLAPCAGLVYPQSWMPGSVDDGASVVGLDRNPPPPDKRDSCHGEYQQRHHDESPG
jgi:hypothetical protein